MLEFLAKLQCYGIITALNVTNAESDVSFGERWHTVAYLDRHWFLMCKHSIMGVNFAPLYIHSVKLLQPHTLVEAEKFNVFYNEGNLPTSTADKLRYYRYQKGLLQRDVADFAGIDRSTYNSYESSERDSFPPDKMALVAQLLEIEIVDLLDEYNSFIYHGQGRQIKAKRKAMGLTQCEFGKLYGVNKHTAARWENDDVRIFKSTWEKLFK